MNENEALLAVELHKLNPSAIVELFELDARPAGDDSVLYFHNGTQGMTVPVTFQGLTYMPMPIQVKGFDISTTGEPPRPTLSIANPNGFLSAMVLKTQDLVSSKLTRRRTFARFLDGMPDAAPVYLTEDVFYVEQKVREGRRLVEFELGTSLDLDGIQYPLRTITSGYCPAVYRGDGCQFAISMVVANETHVFFEGGKNYAGMWNADGYMELIGSVDAFDKPIKTPSGYKTGHSVSYFLNGFTCVFVCLQDITGPSPAPGNTAYWKQVQRYRGEYSATVQDYVLNDVVSRMVSRQKVYAISIWTGAVPIGQAPPNALFWRTDQCAKYLLACQDRFDPLRRNLPLPFNGFPGTISMPE